MLCTTRSFLLSKQYTQLIMRSNPRTTSYRRPAVSVQAVESIAAGLRIPIKPVFRNTELAAVVPSEVTASTRATSEYGAPYHGVVEADSTRQSHITSPVSELGNNPYEKPTRTLSIAIYGREFSDDGTSCVSSAGIVLFPGC